MKKLKGKTNRRNGRKGEKSTAKQPEIPRPGTEQLRVLDNPIEGIAAVDLRKDNQRNK